MVFVEQRIMAVVLSRLVNSLPALRAGGGMGGRGIRARPFLGHNERSGAAEVVMSAKVIAFSGCLYTHGWV
jgi:hypothetical protein